MVVVLLYRSTLSGLLQLVVTKVDSIDTWIHFHLVLSHPFRLTLFRPSHDTSCSVCGHHRATVGWSYVGTLLSSKVSAWPTLLTSLHPSVLSCYPLVYPILQEHPFSRSILTVRTLLLWQHHCTRSLPTILSTIIALAIRWQVTKDWYLARLHRPQRWILS